MPTQGASITVAGGLDLVSSSHALFRTPGAATILENFESSTTGGYRRINGYTKWGGASAAIPTGSQLDSITGDGDTNTAITFSGSDVITVSAGGSAQVTFTDGAIVPSADDDLDLGTGSAEFKDLYLDGTANIDSLVADTADINGGSIDGVTIGSNAVATIINVDNLRLDANTFSSTNSIILKDKLSLISSKISYSELKFIIKTFCIIIFNITYDNSCTK